MHKYFLILIIKYFVTQLNGNMNSKFLTATGIITNSPKQVIKDNWDTFPGGTFLLNINCGTVYGAIVQKVNSSFGSAIIFGYAADAIVFIRKNNTNWLE